MCGLVGEAGRNNLNPVFSAVPLVTSALLLLLTRLAMWFPGAVVWLVFVDLLVLLFARGRGRFVVLGSNAIVFFKFVPCHHDALTVAMSDHNFFVSGFFALGEDVSDSSLRCGF